MGAGGFSRAQPCGGEESQDPQSEAAKRTSWFNQAQIAISKALFGRKQASINQVTPLIMRHLSEITTCEPATRVLDIEGLLFAHSVTGGWLAQSQHIQSVCEAGREKPHRASRDDLDNIYKDAY